VGESKRYENASVESWEQRQLTWKNEKPGDSSFDHVRLANSFNLKN
jgi:hypothetical protein